tara:strand:+ start:3948 stop:4145 length:198 start_codon:yes stop_codon:yes gene_type:complete
MSKLFQLLGAILGLLFFNSALGIMFNFYDIKKEFYNEYMNWINAMIIFAIILPDNRGKIIQSLLD